MELAFLIDENIFNKKAKVFINKVDVDRTTRCHAHHFIEVAYVSSGKGIHRLNNVETACFAGDYYIINYNVPHEFISEEKMTVINCIFSLSFIDYSMLNCMDFNKLTNEYLTDIVLPLHSNASDKKFHDNGHVGAIFDKMYEEYSNRSAGYLQVLRSLVMELLIYTLRMAGGESPLADVLENNINQVISYLREHLSDDISVSELAMMAFLSPAYFCRLFKDKMNMTVTEFRQKLRIDRAKRLLLTTDKTVEEIAGMVGYSDLHYFRKLFSKAEGASPARFRKEHLRK